MNPKLELSNGKLFLFGLSSLLLCASIFMSVFAPFPLAMAVVLYGRLKGYLIGLFYWLMSFAFSIFVMKDISLFVFYALVMIFAAFISETFFHKISPKKSLIGFGLSFILGIGILTYGTIQVSNIDVKKFIVSELTKSKERLEEQKELLKKSSEESAFDSLALLEQPELMADNLIKSAPVGVFIGVFFVLWANLMLFLRSRKILFGRDIYPYSENELLAFKMPDNFIWVVIAVFAVAIWGDEYIKLGSADLGMSLLKCIGVFYFFQGFGVLNKLLDFIKLGGIFRTFIVMLTIITVNWLIALVGLFDVFFNFNKLFVKKNND
jgi:hypothetical protein